MQTHEDALSITDHASGQVETATGPVKWPWHRPAITLIEIKQSMFDFAFGDDLSGSAS